MMSITCDEMQLSRHAPIVWFATLAPSAMITRCYNTYKDVVLHAIIAPDICASIYCTVWHITVVMFSAEFLTTHILQHNTRHADHSPLDMRSVATMTKRVTFPCCACCEPGPAVLARPPRLNLMVLELGCSSSLSSVAACLLPCAACCACAGESADGAGACLRAGPCVTQCVSASASDPMGARKAFMAACRKSSRIASWYTSTCRHALT
jgi:hypothetical protein